MYLQIIFIISIVPTPNVTVTTLNNQPVGDPLLLECNITTVRGITSSVDIVWITNDEEVKTVKNVSGETADNSVVYRSIYNDSEISQDNKTYQCTVMINASPVINATDIFVCKLYIYCSLATDSATVNLCVYLTNFYYI